MSYCKLLEHKKSYYCDYLRTFLIFWLKTAPGKLLLLDNVQSCKQKFLPMIANISDFGNVGCNSHVCHD